ncbi:MBL fold metallo-hydrolase [Jannaschia sp. Os4]|uniref:MBL fold metallo-hydrolase n=1 Tax=Jannaschia sp. Os4 TaxID=2807617 RepID=UPI001939B09A|nr:MBL fold metallo-hydrolase [Jannaschia sp. Os4]MBM2574937.1 MBL fold metallo-hydrolase [Jannaschia sp. Os4]
MIRLLLVLLLLAAPAAAQDRRPSHCIAIAQAPGLEYVHRVAYGAPLPDAFTVRLSYVDHSMFMLETPGGLRAVTDFNGYVGQVARPDVVTMNRGHITHWDPTPDPDIPHILPGWNVERPGQPADHHLDLGEMLVRSVSTDLRPGQGGEDNGNSIFVFEVGGLCIGHLGHLHHEPSPEDYAALGRLDVVMAPVDGGLTLPRETLIRVLGRLRSSVILPMHWFGEGTLQAFLRDMEGTFPIERRAESHIDVSLRTLPDRPTVIVLPPRFLRDE